MGSDKYIKGESNDSFLIIADSTAQSNSHLTNFFDKFLNGFKASEASKIRGLRPIPNLAEQIEDEFLRLEENCIKEVLLQFGVELNHDSAKKIKRLFEKDELNKYTLEYDGMKLGSIQKTLDNGNFNVYFEMDKNTRQHHLIRKSE